MRNYGRGTPIATVLAHIAYGAIVGGLRLDRRADGESLAGGWALMPIATAWLGATTIAQCHR